jgi:2,3-bisphosphoglycerate-dependent phosphoglycerate mutase
LAQYQLESFAWGTSTPWGKVAFEYRELTQKESFTMGKLILVRHGKTVLNSLDDTERLRGWMDIPLDEQGLREAQQTARHVAQHAVQRIYCSDLYRAKQTAEAVVRATQAHIVYTSDLRPWNLGNLTGQRVADILPTLLQLEVDLEMPAPGGESFLAFYTRYSKKLMELLEIAEQSPSCIVAVTHHRNLLAAPTILEDGDKTKIPVRGGARTGDLLWVERTNNRWTTRIDTAMAPGDTLKEVASNSLVQPLGSPRPKPSVQEN